MSSVCPKTFVIKHKKRKEVNFKEFGDMTVYASSGQTSRIVDIEKIWDYIGPADQTPKNINQIINEIGKNKWMIDTEGNSATENMPTRKT